MYSGASTPLTNAIALQPSLLEKAIVSGLKVVAAMNHSERIDENAGTAEIAAETPSRSFTTVQQYDSNTLLIYAIGSTLYNIIAFYTFAFATENDIIQSTSFALAVASIVCQMLSILTLWIIWAVAPDQQKHAFYPNAVQHLWVMQSLYPLLVSAAVCLRLVATLMVGDCSKFGHSQMVFASFCDPYYHDGGITLRLVMELMFTPVLAGLLLRDTPPWALVASWAVAVGTLVTFTIALRSTDIGVTTAAYVFCSALAFVDSTRYYRRLMDALAQLQLALVEGIRQAKQEQATELRAMMSNLAHDLKTVST